MTSIGAQALIARHVPRYSKDVRTERSLRHSFKDGIAYSVMIGSGESFFSAFAVFLRASTTQVGILATFPPLIASFAQLFSSWLGRRSGKRKAIIVAGASLQALALFPLAILPLLFPDHALPILIGCAILYFCGANLAAPQWGSLIGDLFPSAGADATRTAHATMQHHFLPGPGLCRRGVDLFDRNAYTAAGYLLVFAVAAGARLVSVYHLWRMYDPPGHTAALESPFRVGLWRRLRGSSFARFSLFFAAMQFAVSISGPFFVVYMLRDLGFSYLEFTILTAASVLVQFLTLNRWGRISDAFGNRYILVITGLMIPILPALWLVSTNYVYLLLIQAFGGLAWAGFTLSAVNYLFDLIPSERRATQMALHNVLASIGVFCGALLGGYLGTHLPTSIDLFGTHYEWFSALYGVFLLSTVARLAVAAVFLRHLEEIRPVRKPHVGGLIFRVCASTLSGRDLRYRRRAEERQDRRGDREDGRHQRD